MGEGEEPDGDRRAGRAEAVAHGKLELLLSQPEIIAWLGMGKPDVVAWLGPREGGDEDEEEKEGVR